MGIPVKLTRVASICMFYVIGSMIVGVRYEFSCRNFGSNQPNKINMKELLREDWVGYFIIEFDFLSHLLNLLMNYLSSVFLRVLKFTIIAEAR